MTWWMVWPRRWLLLLLAVWWGEVVLAKPESPHVVLVTPRGETVMERVFKQELTRMVPGVRFSLMHPDLEEPGWADKLPARVRQVRPDLIYTWGTPVTLALAGPHDRPVIADVPIVFAVVAYPQEARLVKSLEFPGRNLTGASHLIPLSVQLGTMRLYRPFTRLGVVFNPKESNARVSVRLLEEAGQRGGFDVVSEPVPLRADGVPDPTAIPALVQRLKAQGADWLYLGPDTFVAYTHRRLTTQAAAQAGLPSFSANESAVLDGDALLGVYSPASDMARYVAFKAAQVLTGEQAIARSSVDTLQRFRAVVNLCVARALKMPPPPAVSGKLDLLDVDGFVRTSGGRTATGCRPLN